MPQIEIPGAGMEGITARSVSKSCRVQVRRGRLVSAKFVEDPEHVLARKRKKGGFRI